MTAINSKSENVALAAEFLAFMHSAENDARFVEAGMTTSLKDGSWPAELADVKPVFDDIDVILQTGGGIESNPEIKPVFSENFIKLAAGQINAEEFVKRMAAAAKQ
jgi:raffinose/stachyose/melibiose transport system substrate-binding protein